ncbi:MAG: hypothetical protein M3Q95_10170 [Bacteroidota bacterium]|nr:hypothetical protein [Bacteroidota bacterium]
MNDNLEQLKELKIKVEKLINLHVQLVKHNQQLQLLNNQLIQKDQQQHGRISELEEKIKVIKLAQQLSGSDQNTRDIKLKINEYIREIDKCLGLINR